MKFLAKQIEAIKKLFENNEKTETDVTRIESARVTSSRLNALKRMRENSKTTPTYKKETGSKTSKTEPGKRSTKNVDLDFGLELPNS